MPKLLHIVSPAARREHRKTTLKIELLNDLSQGDWEEFRLISRYDLRYGYMTVRALLSEMEQEGLIARRPSEGVEEHRVGYWWMQITEAGRQFVDQRP